VPNALVIYAAALAKTRMFSQKVQKEMEDLGIAVKCVSDKNIREIKSFAPFAVIAAGAACRSCSKCHGAADCRGTRRLNKSLQKQFSLDLTEKKLVSFALCDDPAKQACICHSIENIFAQTGIAPAGRILCGEDAAIYDDAIHAIIQPQMFE
jgi:hypothetical protein